MTVDRDETLEASAGEPAAREPAREPARELAPGSRVDARYRIVRFVAAGGMGEVYAAEDLMIGTTVALKIMRADRPANAEAIERMKREIAFARQVTDSHVCRVHDVGEHAGRWFLTMELLDGKTLADHIAASSGGLPLAEVERLARQLVAGMEALHRAGIVHRDFKSANVMLVRGRDDGAADRAVITDFGLARSLDGDASLTAEAAMLGTPAYMAPEQVRGEPATSASDIYALGIVLFEMLTGTRPFRGSTPLAIASARLSGPTPDPSLLRSELPERWRRIVMRCLARDPADRFARVVDVLSAVEQPATPRSRRGFVIAGASAVGAVATAGVVVALTASGSRTVPPDRAGSAFITRLARTMERRSRLLSRLSATTCSCLQASDVAFLVRDPKLYR